MAIPAYDEFMLPLLKKLADGTQHSMTELRQALAEDFQINPEERSELLPSGRQSVLYNRIGWAKTYLKKAGLVDSPKRGTAIITERGRSVLKNPPPAIDVDFLKRYEEFVEFQRTETGERAPQKVTEMAGTPEETLESAYQQLRESLAEEILEKLKTCSPAFFENLVVELLVAMGYGGSLKDAGQILGSPGDSGVDGVIKEDRLGLDVIYIQAKKWDGCVGRPEVQKFVGALQGQRARKGVFITTAAFSKEAVQYAGSIDSKVILIDGKQLAQYMIDFNLGVTKVVSFEIKRLDSDYFAEE